MGAATFAVVLVALLVTTVVEVRGRERRDLTFAEAVRRPSAVRWAVIAVAVVLAALNGGRVL